MPKPRPTRAKQPISEQTLSAASIWSAPNVEARRQRRHASQNLELAAALLAIIADPKSAKDHLEKIRSEMELLHRKAAETAKAAAELDERQRELNEREVALAGADAIINEATRAKDEAAAIKRDLDEQHREHDAREAAIAAREHSLNKQENVYRIRQRDLDDRQKQLEEAESDYARRSEFLKSFGT